MDKDHVERFVEFLTIGVVMGVIEDLIALKLATGDPITLEIVGIVFIVAIPFAAFSELVVDHKDFKFTEKIASKISR